MKILFLSPIFLENRLDGASRIEILKQLANHNEITFLSLRSKKSSQSPKEHLTFIQVPLRDSKVISTIVFSIYLFFYLPVILQLTKPDVLVVESEIFLPSTLTSMPIVQLRKIKTVLDIRSPPVETSGLQGTLQITSYNISVNFARKLFNGVSALTPMMLDDVCKRFRILEKPVTYWSSGVSTALFDPKCSSQSATIRRELGIPEDAFVLFYHGSLSENRGIIQLVTAMSSLQTKNLNLVLLIVGQGPAEKKIKSIISEKHIKNVILHGSVPYEKVPHYIGTADVCIVPLPNHPFWLYQSPLKLLEYMSMEKVVIVTNIPAHRGIIGEGKFAIYISSVEPIKIEESIIYAYNNRDSLKSWGLEGRQIVLNEYTWTQIGEKLEKYFKKLVFKY